MHYCGTKVQLELPLSSVADFGTGDVCRIFSPSRGRKVGDWFMVIAVTASSDGISGKIRVTFSVPPFGSGNDYIADGDYVEKPNGIRSNILGPFFNFYDNTASLRTGRGFLEPLYNPERHDLFTYDVDGSNVRASFPLNPGFIS